jgi:hypothetical protein
MEADMTPERAMLTYQTPLSERAPLLDEDLLAIAAAFPMIEVVMMEMQYLRDENARLREVNWRLELYR